MGFQIGQNILPPPPGLAHSANVQPHTLHGFLQGCAIAVTHLADIPHSFARHGSGTKHGKRKARPFLIPKSHNLKGEGEPQPTSGKGCHTFHTQHYA